MISLSCLLKSSFSSFSLLQLWHSEDSISCVKWKGLRGHFPPIVGLLARGDAQLLARDTFSIVLGGCLLLARGDVLLARGGVLLARGYVSISQR